MIIKDDNNYRNAVNYDNTNYYNFPVTFNYNNKKYIIGFGSKDRVNIFKKGECFYLVGENYELNYISMYYIDTNHDIVKDCFLHDEDINNPDSYSYDIFNKDIEEQVRILSEYIEF